MQRLSGVLMVLAGTALGGYMVLPSPKTIADKLADLAQLSSSAESGANVGDARSSPALASPGLPAGGETRIAPTTAPRVFSATAPLAPPAAAPAPATTWTAVVTSEPNAQGNLKSSRPGDYETRAQLAGDLQRELKRVGCYGGEITGSWTPSTKRAMSEFMDRVNATLPVDEPDYILLTLVQGHAAIACGADCPSGQVMSGGGRCVPQQVVAQASRKLQRLEERRIVEARRAQQQERLVQEHQASEARRMAEARKTADVARIAAAAMPQAKPGVSKAAKAQQTAALMAEKLPWLDEIPASTAENGPVLERVLPPPGMMSIGGPRVSAPEMPAGVAAVTPDRGPDPATAFEGAGNEASTAAATADGVIVAPAPRRAVRPAAWASRQNAVQGLPGTKSGPAVQRRYPSAKIVRRPPPHNGYYQRPRTYYYASNYGKPRRGQPRPGTLHCNVLQSMGGIY